MKKILTLLSLTAGTFAFGQSLQVLEHGTSNPVPANVIRYVDVTQGDDVKFDIKNLTNSALTYKVRKRIISTPAGCATPNSLMFCDALNCYAGSPVSTSATHLPLAANQIVDPNGYGIKADLMGGSCEGTYVVRYTVFVTANGSLTNDSTSFLITYNATPTGINAIDSKNFVLGNISPNPVAATAVVKYDFPYSPSSASIKIYNMVGSLIKEVKLDGQEGKASFDLSTISEGVYFYSLTVNDKVVNTKKLLVAH